MISVPSVQPTSTCSTFNIDGNHSLPLFTPEREKILLASDVAAKVSEMTTGVHTYECDTLSAPLRSGSTGVTYISKKPCKQGHWLRYRRNKHCVECLRNWRRTHIDAYRISHREESAVRIRTWKKANPGRAAAARAEGKKHVRRATPKWLTLDDRQEISQFYLVAYRRTLETGIEHHVDHWAPLRSPIVSGLHIPSNLQILRKDENQKKHNRFDENAPYYGRDEIFL